MNNMLYLRQNLSVDSEELKSGKFKGVAYSGSVIEEHGFLQNLIIDLSTLKVAKKKTPVLRDHNTSQVAGNGEVTIDSQVLIEGNLSKKSLHGAEIINLAEDGTDWEMSLGVYGGQLREFKKETINGIYMESGVVLENGTIREVSFVILGADMNTEAEVFQIKKLEGDPIMKLSDNASYVALACGCGGNKDTTPEELAEKFKASQAEIDSKQAEIDKMKADLKSAQEELAKMKGDSETKANAEAIKAAADEKGVKISQEAIDKASASKEATEVLVNTFKAMEKVETKVSTEFTEKVVLGGGATEIDTEANDAETIRLSAEALVKEGKQPNFMKAIEFLQKNKGEN